MSTLLKIFKSNSFKIIIINLAIIFSILQSSNILCQEKDEERSEIIERIERLKKCVKISPKNIYIRQNLVAALLELLQTGNYIYKGEILLNLIKVECEEILKLKPGNVAARRVIRIIEYFPDPQERKPKGKAKGFAKKGENLLKEGKLQDAITNYFSAIKEDKKCALLYLQLGDIFFFANKFEKALKIYNKAKKIAPKNFRTYYFISKIYTKQGKFEKGKSALFDCIERYPNYNFAWEELKNISKKLGKKFEKLRAKRNCTLKVGKDGKISLILKEKLKTFIDRLWLAYAYGRIKWIKKNFSKKDAKKPYSISFKEELQGFKEMIKVWKKGISDKKIPNKYFETLEDINNQGYLAAYIYVIEFRESFRGSFEKWKEKNPDKIKKFLSKFVLKK